MEQNSNQTNTGVNEKGNDRKNTGKKTWWIPLLGLVVAALATSAYIWLLPAPGTPAKPAGITAQKQEISIKTEATGEQWNFQLVKSAFAAQAEPALTALPSLSYDIPAYDQLENKGSFTENGTVLSEVQIEALEQYGFFLAENLITGDQSGYQASDDFVDLYDAFDGNGNDFYREGDDAVFITSDLALHLYHILIDRSFQRIEETRFQPMLRAMSEALFLNSLEKYNSLTDPALKDSYKRLSIYYLIPLLILDTGSASANLDIQAEDYDTFAKYLEAMNEQRIINSQGEFTFALTEKTYAGQDMPNEIYETAKAELELTSQADKIASSPLFSVLRPEFLNDYTQFTPRSHYTKNDILKSYFIAMMWYGRMGFTLNSPELTRDALLITGQINNLMVGEQKLSQIWSDMMSVIDFFVGEVDDLTAFQYTDIINRVAGREVNENEFTKKAFLDEFKEKAVEQLPPPRIISEALLLYDDAGKRKELLAETMQFRFMGQRFTPDAYIINNLTQGLGSPDPETGQMLPSMPTALMPVHILRPDNKIAKSYLDEWVNDPARIERQGRISDKIIAKKTTELIGEFNSYDPNIWTQNIYWSWLNLFKPLLSDYSAGYPAFMQNDNWQKKNLGTVLGSYTELKHDTLLYAKQSYAELGGGGPTPDEKPPVVKGYVEPDLLFWGRIINLAQTTVDGLDARNVFPEVFRGKYESFIESCEFFEKLAAQELADQTIDEDDFEKLRTISHDLRYVVNPILGQELTKKEKRAGIIADIHTDALLGEILYEATGKPEILFVAVQDANGTRLTRGAVFNHYEFTDKLDKRLADEDWQEIVYDEAGILPPRDKWTKELIK